MRQVQTVIRVATRGRSLYEFTKVVNQWLHAEAVSMGLLTLFCQHTSASLTIQENADPDVQHDLDLFFQKLVPEGVSGYRHVMEGPDDMPAHIKGALTDVSLTIPV
ncbi:MAG: secondary thiamine-phosphate synthase enzyme YjbQ, partial [Magnetococcus sp. XQGC-1]